MRTQDDKKAEEKGDPRVWARLREWEEGSRLKGKEIAKRAGIPASYYSEICKSRKPGTVETLGKIAEATGHTLSELFVGIGSIPSPEPRKKIAAQDEAATIEEVERLMPPELRKTWERLVQNEAWWNEFQRWLSSPPELRQAIDNLISAARKSQDESGR